jgi:hypothetical protein
VTRLAAFLRNGSGAAAAEFALVLPIALLFFFGIFDVGRYVWAMNELEKAVQMGTRYAVATRMVPEGLGDKDFVGIECGGVPLTPGATICKDALGTITCTMPGSAAPTCSCVGGQYCPDPAGDPDAFNAIVRRMQVVAPFIDASDVAIKYSGSGIGYAGDPLSDVSPVVTVEVKSLTVRLMLLLGGRVRLPGFSYSQTLEDGDGVVAY